MVSKEWVSMSVTEITSIPHISVISAETTEAETIDRYRKEFVNTLSEVFSVYKNSGYREDVALEILWKAVPVEKQPFRARIGMYIIVRTIAASREQAEDQTGYLTDLISGNAAYLKYETLPLPAEEHVSFMADVGDEGIRAVVKEESAQNMENMLFPVCYTFSRIPVTASDLSRIAAVLTDSPGTAVSFQLIPSVYSMEESAELDRTAQNLETLSKGVADQSLGSVSFTLATRHSETYRYYADSKTSPLFLFNVIVYGGGASLDNTASRVSAELASGDGQNANLKIIKLNPADIRKDRNLYPLPWVANSIIMGTDRNLALWNSKVFSSALQRFPYIITAEEASAFFRLPIGSSRISAGFKVNESERDSRTYREGIINSGDITVGKLRSAGNDASIGFSLSDLAKHMLVVGTPGSGKTTFSVGLLDRLWKDHGIPFLVIEPAKNEYRALVQSIPDLQVFTPGKNLISPFMFNPFIPPRNVKLETYKSTLKTAFAAGVSMTSPLDKIFEETVNNCYSDFRWLDTYTSDDKGKVFNISDFVKCFRETFEAIGYTGDARNVGRAGEVRLKGLVNLFDNYGTIPVEDMLSRPTVIELAAIENSEEKALIISLLLLSILAYVNANYVGEGGLRNVILLEEAHVLLDAGTNHGLGDANPSAVAQGLVKRMLAEIRSYGVGLIIADQSPRKVTTDVVALTDMKVVFRLVENEDRQIIANSTGMSETQEKRMAKLKPGEAFLFFGKLDEPEEVVTPDYRLENNISISLSDDGIRELSTYWKTRAEQTRPYPQCAACPDCTGGCDYARRILARDIARRIFNRYVGPVSADKAKCKDAVKKLFPKLEKLTVAELNDEVYSKALLRCVKLHLLRRVRYETKLEISDSLIEETIKR